ncbi:aldo/keto reductase [Candidatus Latescibacterota bacterium]
MPHDNLSRRNFLKEASVTAAAGAVGFSGLDCASVKKSMKYVTLGRTGMNVSQFLGDRMADNKLYELAIASGINYWHKIGTWAKPAPYEMFQKLDRDSFYCDTTVGTLEKDNAIDIFERALEKSGLEYIDGFKVHSQYSHAEDIKNETGVLEAFEQLKKQGKTRHLMMSQHINTAEVFEAAVESEIFDVIQVPVNPTVPRDYFTKEEYKHRLAQDEYLALIQKAADKGIAITAMKVFLYGSKYWEEVPDLKKRVEKYLPDIQSIATALIHWALDVPGVLAYGSMLYTFDELSENLSAIGGTLTSEEDLGLKQLSNAISSHVCRMCGACQRANPGGVAVSDICRYMGYSIGHGNHVQARALYTQLSSESRGENISDYASYEKACPYNLPVGDMMKKARMLFG